MSVNDLTTLISPAFTESTVLEILNRKSSTKNKKILEITIDTDKGKAGDSYLSTICRFVVKASGTNDSAMIEHFSVPVIVKFFPKNIPRQKTFRSADFFRTEIEFYTKVWPEMKKLKIAKMPNEPDDVPFYLASYCDGKHDFIALEDLGYEGFKASSRSDEVTKEKLSLFLKALANFHALGIMTKLENPKFAEIVSSLPESYFSKELKWWYNNFMYNSMGPQYQKAIKAVGLDQRYFDKVTEMFCGDLYGEVLKCCSVQDKLCTVSEGDCWLPNFLPKQDKDGNFLACKFIDFQLARYAPITNDLIHFLYSAVPNEILLKRWDNLIVEYHQYLSARIEELGGKKDHITLNDIIEEIYRYPILGLVMSMESILMALLTDDEVADLDILEGDKAYPLEQVWKLPEFDHPRSEKLAFLVKHAIDKRLF